MAKHDYFLKRKELSTKNLPFDLIISLKTEVNLLQSESANFHPFQLDLLVNLMIPDSIKNCLLKGDTRTNI